MEDKINKPIKYYNTGTVLGVIGTCDYGHEFGEYDYVAVL